MNSFPCGSSPRVRGKHPGLRSCRCESRIIPARAGQTDTANWPSALAADHPRACGANAFAGQWRGHGDGSSPRVRGKRCGRIGGRLIPRIIPARAGQTRCSRTARTLATDHPRACGANTAVVVGLAFGGGSSPRVRGKLVAGFNDQFKRRIIPARAGQTVRFYAKTLERWTLNNWIRTVAPIFVLLFLLPVIGQNAYIERHYSNQSFSWFSKLHYASAFDLSLVA